MYMWSNKDNHTFCDKFDLVRNYNPLYLFPVSVKNCQHNVINIELLIFRCKDKFLKWIIIPQSCTMNRQSKRTHTADCQRSQAESGRGSPVGREAKQKQTVLFHVDSAPNIAAMGDSPKNSPRFSRYAKFHFKHSYVWSYVCRYSAICQRLRSCFRTGGCHKWHTTRECAWSCAVRLITWTWTWTLSVWGSL